MPNINQVTTLTGIDLVEIRKRADEDAWYGGTATRDVRALLNEVEELHSRLAKPKRRSNRVLVDRFDLESLIESAMQLPITEQPLAMQRLGELLGVDNPLKSNEEPNAG